MLEEDVTVRMGQWEPHTTTITASGADREPVPPNAILANVVGSRFREMQFANSFRLPKNMLRKVIQKLLGDCVPHNASPNKESQTSGTANLKAWEDLLFVNCRVE
ncbi:hypothetical protein CEXT_104791 [Caerostris extrusa]|uniref:Uncharacterized protein n=1 Tax=Caerostris extrusa TaxID=172846 RepID=A0AAV4XUU6_CAEEX|nr:hypothetical protein CEXT_104791 [Caerostris extrusa]